VAFAEGGAAELAAPDDQRFIEEATALEVADQGGDAQIGYVPIYVGQVTDQPPPLCRMPSPRC
jgi:hypothetical protein